MDMSSVYQARSLLSAFTAVRACSQAASHFSLDSLSSCLRRCCRCPSRPLISASFWNCRTLVTRRRSAGRRRSTSASSAAASSSFNFFTVSLPMWLSLEMGSSRLGISCFFRFFVRFVTTTNSSPTAGRTGSGVPSERTHRTISRNGGRFVPDSTDSEDSVTLRSAANTTPSAPNFSTTCGESPSPVCAVAEVSSGSRRWLRSTMQSRRMDHDCSPSSRHRDAYLLPSRMHASSLRLPRSSVMRS
mmetsp:Transcript_2898/g.8488  ORF Transcript_2898/g.8488 Transcript_2898/m.8488 type:complete len:245 (-) Transcript_2898:49-783(-)